MRLLIFKGGAHQNVEQTRKVTFQVTSAVVKSRSFQNWFLDSLNEVIDFLLQIRSLRTAIVALKSSHPTTSGEGGKVMD